MNNGQISGWFISWTTDEEKAIKDGLQFSGYDPDVKGLKKMLLDGFREDREAGEEEPSRSDEVINKIASYIQANPETVRMYGRIAGGFVQNFLKRKKARA